MGVQEQIDAATASVRRRLADGVTESDLAAQIREYVVRGTPAAPRFDPYQLRMLALELARDEATRPRAVVLVRALTAAMPDDKFNWGARSMIGRYYTKDYADTILAATRAIDRGLKNSATYGNRGVALLERAEPGAALADLDRALADPPTDPSDVRLLEALRAQARRTVAAIELVRELHDQLDAGQVSSWELVRRWSPIPLTPADIGDVAAGKKHLAIDFEWPAAVSYAIAEVAYAYFERGAHRVARQVFGALVLVNTRDGYMRTMEAACAAKLGDRTAAIAGYSRALDLNPKDVPALVNRGELFLDQGEIARALDDVAAAVALDPEGAEAHANRGRAMAWAVADVFPEHRARAEAARGPLRLGPDAEEMRREILAKLRARDRVTPAAAPDAPAPHAAHQTPPVRILFLAANPTDQARLALTREVETFSERLRATSHRDAYEIVQHWEVEAIDLQGLILRHKPQIVHFSGHGTTSGELAFQDADGNSAPLSVPLIANVFSILKKYVRCVVLNACFSRPQAVAIVKSVEVVVGMSAAIPDTDAIAFAGAFYEALGYGEDVQTAFELARNAIAIESRDPIRDVGRNLGSVPDDGPTDRPGIPELLTRSDVDASTIRFVDVRC